MDSISPVDQLRRALGAVEEVVTGIGTQQWDAATPCSEWTVRQVANHLVGGNELIADLLAAGPGTTMDEVRGRLPGDLLGDDPVAAYRRSAERMLAAFAPERMAQLVAMPIGTVPGAVAAQLRVTETLTHGWDLARATGQTLQAPDDVAEPNLQFTLANLGRVPAGRSPFGQGVPVPEDAAPLDRLVGALGRDPGWHGDSPAPTQPATLETGLGTS